MKTEVLSFGAVAGNFSSWLAPRPIWTTAPFHRELPPRRGRYAFGESSKSSFWVCVGGLPPVYEESEFLLII